jgi:hypothetical protein
MLGSSRNGKAMRFGASSVSSLPRYATSLALAEIRVGRCGVSSRRVLEQTSPSSRRMVMSGPIDETIDPGSHMPSGLRTKTLVDAGAIAYHN